MDAEDLLGNFVSFGHDECKILPSSGNYLARYDDLSQRESRQPGDRRRD